MDSIRQMARDLLRQYRHNHTGEQTPAMKALEEIDDEDTRQLYDVRLTEYDLSILKSWGLKR